MKASLFFSKPLARLYTPVLSRHHRPRHISLDRQYSQVSMSNTKGEEDFFRFTSGRWLWNEEERLRERYRRFDISALKEIAVAVSGANRCVSMCKLAEGGFNKVFRLTMDNESSLIARIPNKTSETASRSLASEVATMDFVSICMQSALCSLLSSLSN